jgi:hypothetical protein
VGKRTRGLGRSNFLSVEASRFQLYKRTKHVYSEALRVLNFRATCIEAEDGDQTGLISTLGALMDESQTSCAELFECSCPELDELTALARSSGGHGSRLTGLGSQSSENFFLTSLSRRGLGRVHCVIGRGEPRLRFHRKTPPRIWPIQRAGSRGPG